MPQRKLEDWMWGRAVEMLDRVERIQRQVFQHGRMRQRRPVWEPPLDVFESNDELWLVLALPGVRAEQVEVSLTDRTLRVRGERRMPPIAPDAVIQRLELPYGHFERWLDLPLQRLGLLGWELADGCLSIRLYKL
jgi:HSP20 family molecular chaperone IbpA